MIYTFLKKKNKCGECQNEGCSLVGDKFVDDFHCVSYKSIRGGMSEWQKTEEEKKKKEEAQKRGSRSGAIWDYDYDEEEYETQTMDEDYDF